MKYPPTQTLSEVRVIYLAWRMGVKIEWSEDFGVPEWIEHEPHEPHEPNDDTTYAIARAFSTNHMHLSDEERLEEIGGLRYRIKPKENTDGGA